jgi:hypothetical protein
MSTDGQAGTPEPKQDGTVTGGTPEGAKDGSGSEDQKWQEALKWKQKAEDFNKVAEEKRILEARNQELERIAYGRGAGQATDPTAERLAALREAATYDPASWAALQSLETAARTEAEVWLTGATLSVPESKREQVKANIRNSGYKMSPEYALSLVTDPDAVVANDRVKQLEAENERLRSAKPNGSSPAAATPSSMGAQHSDTIKRSEYLAVLAQGGQRAKELMQAVGSNKTKLSND